LSFSSQSEFSIEDYRHQAQRVSGYFAMLLYRLQNHLNCLIG
jgi:hypothetical protein